MAKKSPAGAPRNVRPSSIKRAAAAIGLLALASAAVVPAAVNRAFAQSDSNAPSNAAPTTADPNAPTSGTQPPAPNASTPDTNAPTNGTPPPAAPTTPTAPDTTTTTPSTDTNAPAPPAALTTTTPATDTNTPAPTAEPVPTPPTPAPAPEEEPVPTWPAGNADYILYRQTPDPLGSHNGIVLWVRGNGTDVTLRVRLMTMDPTSTTPDTAMLRPMWISVPITVRSSEWKEVVLPRSKFTLHRLNDAPDGIDPALPADAQSTDETTPEQPKFDDVNTIALETSVPWNSTIAVDGISWADIDDSGAVTNTDLIDNFETGDVAAWTPVGDVDDLRLLQYAVITKPGWVHDGRVAFKINVVSPAAYRKGMEMPSAARAMAITHEPYLVFTPPSTFAKILPSTLPPPGGTSSLISVELCPDQVQAASFCVYTKRPMKDVTVSLDGDLYGTGHILSHNNVDLEVVKVCDELGTTELRDPDTAGPQPELLVKDDRIVLSGTAPAIRLTGDPTTDIAADTTKQFWITITAPRGTTPDTYTGKIIVSPSNAKPFSVPITVTVLPMRLMSPAKQYSIDLRSSLDTPPSTLPAPDGSAFVTDYVSADMLSKQLADIAAHNVHYISIHDSDATVWDAYNARKTAGFLPPFVYMGPTDPKQIEQERTAHQADEFIYYENPDPTGAAKLAVMSKNGLPTATYIAHAADFDSMQDSLDTVIYQDDEDYPQQLVRTHGLRKSMKHDWWYWDDSDDNPRTNRYNCGFLLQRADLYGAFLPSYQLAFGSDPYDQTSAGAAPIYQQFLPEMLTYPAQDGVIDTIQWEAIREGINDERYLTTMYAAMRECKDAHIAKDIVGDAQTYVDSFLDKPLALLSDADYDAARAQIADYAVKLRTAVDAYNKAHGN